MHVNLAPSLDLIITENEGGFADNPLDPGGATNMGITIKTLTAWRRKKSNDPTLVVTVDELKAMPRSEAEDIMASEFADPIDFDSLPPGIDYCVLDTSINSGPARAAMLLQTLVGATPDGIIGEGTKAALTLYLDKMGYNNAIIKYSEARIAFMKSLKTWGTFGKGWAARVARVEDRALKLAAGTTVVAVPIHTSMPVLTQAESDFLTAGGVMTPARIQAASAHMFSTAGVAKATGEVSLWATTSGKHIIAVGASAAITVGAAASQASSLLEPYSSIKYVATAITVLAVLSAVGTFVATLKRKVVAV